MSLKHVNMYFLEIEHQYLEMLATLKEVDPLFKNGEISEEVYQNIQEEVKKLKENYERIAYIMFLLKKPNKKSKREAEISKSWYKALKTSSKEAIINENNDVLSHIKSLIKKGEIGDKNE